MHALVHFSVTQHTKFELPSFTHSKDADWAPKFKNEPRDSDHAH